MTDQRVINTVESLIHNTTGRIKDVQSNLIPFFNKGSIKRVSSYKMHNIGTSEDYMIYDVPYVEDYVNNVIYTKTKDEFPEVGEIGKLYITTTNEEGLGIYNKAYRWNGTEYIEIEYEFKTIIRVEDLKFKDTATPQKYRGVYRIPMLEAVETNVIHPFLLFINNRFIKWSNIEIINDLHYTYLIANGSYYPLANKIDILQLPFNIFYNENGNIKENTELMFSFDEEGKLSKLDAGQTVISYDSSISDIHMDRFDSEFGNIIGEDIINIKDNIKLFPENFILFRDGELWTTANILIDPMNVVSIEDGTANGSIDGRVFYSMSSNIPKNNVYQFHGNDYISELFKNIQISREDDVPYYVTKLREDFNFEYDVHKSYSENITNSINYIYNYNPRLLYPAFTSPIVLRSWTGKEVNELVNSDGNLIMLREKYNGHDTYIIPFLNGELYKWHDQIIYGLSTFTLSVPDALEDDDLLEIIYFRNVDNATIMGHVTKEDPLVSLDGYIERDDLLVYADWHHDMKFPTIGINSKLAYRIDYEWDKETKAMSFDNDYYYGRELGFVSKNRFIYLGYNIRQKCFKFQLSDQFKYCDNQKQFMVFINGRKLSQDEFNITILKNTRPFDDLFIYTAKILNPGDKLDVFYIPYPIEGMYMYKSTDSYNVKITTEKNRLVYDIPVPYKSFLEEGGTFTVQSGNRNIIIDDTMYIVDNNIITFDRGTELPETLIFTMNYKHGKGLNSSGYIYLNKDKLPVPFCKELYMVFVNGKKVPNDQIYNISSDCVRITTDIQSTYDVSVMMYRDIITDLIGLMNTNTSSIDQLVNSINESELNRLNKTFTTITDVEDKFVIDAQKISIINEIVRDFWMRPGINQGVPFLYDYDTDAFIQKDSDDNWIIPSMDATQFINIIEEPEDETVYDLDLPHPGTDPYYDKTTLNE